MCLLIIINNVTMFTSHFSLFAFKKKRIIKKDRKTHRKQAQRMKAGKATDIHNLFEHNFQNFKWAR